MKLLVGLILSLFFSLVKAEQIIANSSANLPKVMTVDEARSIFTLKIQKLGDGRTIQVFLLPRDSLATRRFLTEVLGISPTAYFDMIDNYVSVGKAQLPLSVDSEVRMVISVGSNLGGVGYVRNSDLAKSFSQIHVVLIR